MSRHWIKTSLSLVICFAFIPQAYSASPQNAEHLPSVTLNRITMTSFTDAKSGISFSYPSDWKESKALDADDIAKIEGQLEGGNQNGEIKLAVFKSNEGKITPQFAKSAVHQFIFPKLNEFKSLQEKRVAIGTSRRIAAELEDVEFVIAGIKVRQRYVYFSTVSGTYHFLFTSPAAHFDALVPLYNNVLLSVQVSNPGASKQRINSPSQNKVVVVEKRFDNAQLPFSFAYPGSWKIDSTGNHNEMAKVEGQGPKGEPAYIVVHQGDVHPDWTLDQISEAMEKEFFEPLPRYRRLSKQTQNFGSMSKINGVVEEHTFDLNGAPVKQMVVIFTHNGKAYAVSQVTVGWKEGDTRQLFAKTLAGIKIKD